MISFEVALCSFFQCFFFFFKVHVCRIYWQNLKNAGDLLTMHVFEERFELTSWYLQHDKGGFTCVHTPSNRWDFAIVSK